MTQQQSRPEPRLILLGVPLVLVVIAVPLPVSAAAQIKTPTSSQTSIRDSASAVRTACAIMEALRLPDLKATCLFESYKETPTEYVVKVREQPPPGAPPLQFPHSEVRLDKMGHAATVTRTSGL
jgi:hypothetical protein